MRTIRSNLHRSATYVMSFRPPYPSCVQKLKIRPCDSGTPPTLTSRAPRSTFSALESSFSGSSTSSSGFARDRGEFGPSSGTGVKTQTSSQSCTGCAEEASVLQASRRGLPQPRCKAVARPRLQLLLAPAQRDCHRPRLHCVLHRSVSAGF